MAIGDHSAIDRAVRVLRAQPEPGWHAIEDDVIAAVRATPRGGWPLLVVDPRPGTAVGTLYVSDLALGTLLSRALAGDPDYGVTDIRIQSQSETLQSISVDLSGRYQADLLAAVARAKARCESVVADVVGDMPEVTIAVTVTDVHR
jgi:hypothetical protein